MALTVLLAGCGADTTSNDAPATAEPGQVEQVCHDQANAQLKAPSTSKFGGDVITGAEPVYTDVGYVDSDNSYGAMIRTTYTCTAIHGDGINFQVKVVLHG